MILRKHFIYMAVIFCAVFTYLHQKIQTFVVAYQLRENYRSYNNLIDKKDYLMYNFAKEISLYKVNQWANKNDFTPVDGERVLAMKVPQEKTFAQRMDLAGLVDRFLSIPTSSANAMPEEE